MSYRPIVLRGLGFCSLSIALAGAFIPLVPTFPFVVLAAFLFSRSSPEWHRWMRLHPRFGSILRDWEDWGIIRWPIKVLTASCVASTMLIPFFVDGVSPLARGVWVALLAPVGFYLLTRPSRRPDAL